MNNIQTTILTYNTIYKEYAKRNSRAGKNIKILRKIFKSKLSSDTNLKILDAGCANGRDIKYFLKQGYCVYGIDLCEAFLELAKKQYPKAALIKMDLRKLQFPRNYFDGIWAMASLLHIPKKHFLQTLKGFYKVLKPEGVFLISVMEGLDDKLRVNPSLNWPERHFSDFQESELDSYCNKAKFKIVHKEKLATSWGPFWLNYFLIKPKS